MVAHKCVVSKPEPKVLKWCDFSQSWSSSGMQQISFNSFHRLSSTSCDYKIIHVKSVESLFNFSLLHFYCSRLEQIKLEHCIQGCARGCESISGPVTQKPCIMVCTAYLQAFTGYLSLWHPSIAKRGQQHGYYTSVMCAHITQLCGTWFTIQ